MTNNTSDPYLAALRARESELSSKDSAIKQEEEEYRAKGEALRIKREQFDADYRAHAAAFSSYVSFLNSTGRANQPAAPGRTPSDVTRADAVQPSPSIRTGSQRQSVLAHLAEVTRRGQKVTSRQIVQATGFGAQRVSNILWKDQERGYITRVGDHVTLSEKGFDFLKQTGVIADSAQPNAARNA